MTNCILYLIFLCYAVTNVHALWEEIAGPYDLTLKYITHCEKKGKVDIFQHMKFSKLNRTHFVFSGLIDLGVDFDSSAKIRLLASNKGTNGRYNNVIDVEASACELSKKFGMEIAKSIAGHCNRTLKCPMRRLTCEMKNWVVNYNIHNIPALPYGEYRLDGSIFKIHQYKRKELIGCVRFIGLVTPKIDKT